MNRLGLVDFWCYEDDEFDFENGHMLLRGSNGSGKSVTMQSMIPLLLDGNRSSERLDPFGTRSRKMDTYLIDENSDRDERIGYLYLEFKRLASDVYKTIGMGIRARKNKPLETWYFVIEDNRRVNIDFKLMENHFTLTKKQLENVLGNQVISSQREYMQKVNDSLFGFENIDDYKDAIDLLLQLRSPKLSNSLSPSKINEILAQSLQPLSEDDLRPMSEAITSMDNLQDDLQNLNTSYDSAKRINQAYDVYNKVLNLISKKIRSEKEINEFLDKYNVDKNKIIDKLKSINLINDKMFAKAYISDRINLSNDGIDKIKNELLKHNIDINLIMDEISKIDNDLIDQKIEKLIIKKTKNSNYSGYKLKYKVVNDLINLGYDKSTIVEIYDNLNIKNDDVIIKEYNKLYNKLSKKYQDKELEYKINMKLFNKGFTKEEIDNIQKN